MNPCLNPTKVSSKKHPSVGENISHPLGGDLNSVDRILSFKKIQSSILNEIKFQCWFTDNLNIRLDFVFNHIEKSII
jgi:hypothetical protein